MNLFNQYVWQPLLAQTITLVGNALSSVVQAIVGLLGLIPEVGGPLAAAIGVPLNAVANQLMSVLTSSALNSAALTLKNFILAQIPGWSADLAKPLAQIVEKIEAAVENAAEEANATLMSLVPDIVKVDMNKGVADANKLKNVTENTLNILKPLLPLVDTALHGAMALVLPKVVTAYDECKVRIIDLAVLVKFKVCSTPA